MAIDRQLLRFGGYSKIVRDLSLVKGDMHTVLAQATARRVDSNSKFA